MDDSRNVYRCTFCGQMVYVLHGGAGELVCCGHPMTRLSEHSSDNGMEKHLPVWTVEAGNILVHVGETEHPMTDKHYIEWIEIESGGQAYRQFLEPGTEPAARFRGLGAGPYAVRACCNVHGLWRK